MALGCARAGDDPATVVFEVTDTGPGIAAAAQDGLFAPFMQADASISREYGGTGLGLAISQQLVQAMGGRIGFESAPGQGSRFWFALPMPAALSAGVAPGAVATSAALEAWDALGLNPKVLLAEDNEINQEVARGALQKCGCRVTTVNNGRAALDAIARESFDLVLMDCQMPELDGLAATRALRQAEQGGARHLPVVALTANAFAADRANCLAAGMDDYISKPFRDGEIAAVLQRWLTPGRSAGAVNAHHLGEAAAAVEAAEATEATEATEAADADTATPASPAGPSGESDAAIFDAHVLARLRDYQVAGEEDMVTGVLKRFLGTAAAQVNAMGAAMGRDDAAAAGAVAHGMKASAAFVGALRLSAACAQLDNAARGSSLPLAGRAFAGVQREYDAALPFLQAALQAALQDAQALPGLTTPAAPTPHSSAGPA